MQNVPRKKVVFNETKNTYQSPPPCPESESEEEVSIDLGSDDDQFLFEQEENLRSSALKNALNNCRSIKALLDVVVTHAFTLHEHHRYFYFNNKKSVSTYSKSILLKRPNEMHEIILTSYNRQKNIPLPISYNTRSVNVLNNILKINSPKKLLEELIANLQHYPQLFNRLELFNNPKPPNSLKLLNNPKYSNPKILENALEEKFSSPEELEILIAVAEAHPSLFCLLSDNTLNAILKFHIENTHSIETLKEIFIKNAYIIDKLDDVHFVQRVKDLEALAKLANEKIPLDTTSTNKLTLLPEIGNIQHHCNLLYQRKLAENPFFPKNAHILTKKN